MEVSTSITNRLLEEIQNRAVRGEPVALARALRKPTNQTAMALVYEDTVFPPLFDRKLTKRILLAVRDMTQSGAAAGLIESADEEGIAITLAIEMIKPRLNLLVFGGGHVGQAVALIAALVGYGVTVIDDREEFASRQRLPDPRIKLLVSDYASAAGRLHISSNTAVVIVTRGHQYDELCLKNVINSEAGYIGMIGSRRRVLSVFKKLAGEGFPEAALQNVHAPIGLQIGARSPQEIAVAILAEIVRYVNNPTLGQKGE